MENITKNTGGKEQQQGVNWELHIPIPIIAAGITVIGAIVVAIIAHQLTLWRSRSDVVRTAVVAYKSAFATEISAISNNTFAMDTFSSAFKRHEFAVEAIRVALPECHQRKLQEAWDSYCGKGNDLGFDAVGFVSATSATVFGTGKENKELFNDFKGRFNVLHSCLDGLL